MEHSHDHDKDPQEKDITRNWVNSSVFLFYLQVFCMIALTIGCSYGLYTQRYKGNKPVPVQPNTLYTPQYK